MARGTDFGGVHSLRDLNLIQQKVVEAPAEPKTNFVNVPGTDGSKDLSTQPAGRVVYKDRKITWTFALYPGDNWAEKKHQVSNALNGRRCRITFDDDPDYYYNGRLTVKSYALDRTLRQITVEATCAPYMLKQAETVINASISTTERSITVKNEFKPALPRITVAADTIIGWNGDTFTLTAGEHVLLDIQFPAGTSTLTAKTVSGTGSISIAYQEGTL